jgi:hypothetical protein
LKLVLLFRHSFHLKMFSFNSFGKYLLNSCLVTSSKLFHNKLNASQSTLPNSFVIISNNQFFPASLYLSASLRKLIFSFSELARSNFSFNPSIPPKTTPFIGGGLLPPNTASSFFGFLAFYLHSFFLKFIHTKQNSDRVNFIGIDI